MTYSLAARLEPERWLVALVSRFPGVGDVVPHGAVGAGVIVYQALGNQPQAEAFLAALRNGAAPERILAEAEVTQPFTQQQVVIVGASGPAAVRAGDRCIPHFGHAVSDDGAAVTIGNLLTNPGVPEVMMDAWLHADGSVIARAIAALRAGSERGGDVRGDSSAAVMLVEPSGVRKWHVVYAMDPLPALIALTQDPASALTGGERGAEHRARLAEYDVAYWKAIAAATSGDFVTAAIELEAQLVDTSDDPQFPETLAYAGMYRIAAGDREGGEALLRRLVTAMPHWRHYLERLPAETWGGGSWRPDLW